MATSTKNCIISAFAAFLIPVAPIEPKIVFDSVSISQSGGYVLNLSLPNDVKATLVDEDGSIFLLNLYSVLVEDYVERLYGNKIQWDRSKFWIVKSFSKWRPLFKAAMQRYILVHKYSVSANELKQFFSLPWMASKNLNPSLDEFSNQTFGFWLSKNTREIRVSVLYTRRQKDKKLNYQRQITSLRVPDEKYPLNSYFSARPLLLPPHSIQKQRLNMILGEKLELLTQSLL